MPSALSQALFFGVDLLILICDAAPSLGSELDAEISPKIRYRDQNEGCGRRCGSVDRDKPVEVRLTQGRGRGTYPGQGIPETIHLQRAELLEVSGASCP